MGNIEKVNERTQEKKLVSYEESQKLAAELLKRFQNEIADNEQKDVDSWGEPYTDFQTSTEHFLKRIPEDILKHYGAHGITRKSTIDRLAGALSILANKSIKGSYGPLGGETYGYGAYKNANFLVISKFDKPLMFRREESSKEEPIFNEIGWEADIGAFVVDVHFYPIV